MEPKEIKNLLSHARLLSGEGGSVSLTRVERRDYAVMSNGQLYCSLGVEGYPETTKVKQKCIAAKVEINTVKPVKNSVIREIYESGSSEVDLDPVEDEYKTAREQFLKQIIADAFEAKATDIRINVQEGHTEVSIRVHGRMKILTSKPQEEGMAYIKACFASAENSTEPDESSWAQGALFPSSGLLPEGLESMRLQYSYGARGRGGLVMRLKPKPKAGTTDLRVLGYTDEQAGLFEIMRTRTNGAYTLAGKVSSGKTTTLQMTMDAMQIEKKGEITSYTLEDPIELAMPQAIQVPVHGSDGFVLGLEAALRSDVNVVVLGEARSEKTASLAMRVVMTGHALWTTIHAGSALGILDRYLDFNVPGWQLTDRKNIRGLVYQRLVGVMCPYCKLNLLEALDAGAITPDLARKMAALFKKRPDELFVRGPEREDCPCGCDNGLVGRTVVAEICMPDEKLLTAFIGGDRQGAFEHWITPHEQGGLGGIPVLHHALSKAGAGQICIHEVEEEVDLLSEYLDSFKPLHSRLARDVQLVEESLPESARASLRERVAYSSSPKAA